MASAAAAAIMPDASPWTCAICKQLSSKVPWGAYRQLCSQADHSVLRSEPIGEGCQACKAAASIAWPKEPKTWGEAIA